MTSNSAYRATELTLADQVWPVSTAGSTVQPATRRPAAVRLETLRALTMVVVGVGFIALLAQLRVQLGPVPFTGQTLAVLLLGAAYGARLGLITTAAYALLGAAGLPLFAGGQSGVAYLLGPTGGYLLGFVLAAGLLGALAQRGWDRSYGRTALAMLAANLIILACGVTWLQAALDGSWSQAFALGVAPFVPGDIIKLVVAVGLLPSAWRWLGRSGA